jgi:hypothetical protein
MRERERWQISDLSAAPVGHDHSVLSTSPTLVMFAQTPVLSPPPRKLSLASIASPVLSLRNLPFTNGHAPPMSRKDSIASVASSSTKVQDDTVDPEELFVKHSVAEIRAIQRKLRWVAAHIYKAQSMTPNAEETQTRSKASSGSWLGT